MSKKTHHSLIIIPGLGDNKSLLNFITRNWEQKYGIKPYVHLMLWKQTSESFEKKLKKLLDLIDQLSLNNELVSLLGTSAGGSAVINAYVKRVSKIHKVINISGRLKEGSGVYPSLELAGKNSPAFIESVKKAEKSLRYASNDFKRKVLTIRPKFGDLIVPASTVSVLDAKNVEIFAIGHVPSIYLALQFPRVIADFIKEN